MWIFQTVSKTNEERMTDRRRDRQAACSAKAADRALLPPGGASAPPVCNPSYLTEGYKKTGNRR